MLLYLSKRPSRKNITEDARALASRITPRSVLRVVEAIIASAVFCLAAIFMAVLVVGALVDGVDDGAMFVTGSLGLIVAIAAFIPVVTLYHRFNYVRIVIRTLDVIAMLLFGGLLLRSMTI